MFYLVDSMLKNLELLYYFWGSVFYWIVFVSLAWFASVKDFCHLMVKIADIFCGVKTVVMIDASVDSWSFLSG